MIEFALKNPPAGASYWYPIVYKGQDYYTPEDWLSLASSWATAQVDSGVIAFRVNIQYADGSTKSKTIEATQVEDERLYTYNWAGNDWYSPAPPAKDEESMVPWILGGIAALVVAVASIAVIKKNSRR